MGSKIAETCYLPIMGALNGGVAAGSAVTPGGLLTGCWLLFHPRAVVRGGGATVSRERRIKGSPV